MAKLGGVIRVSVLLRAGVGAFTAADLLAQRLGFPVMREVNREIRVRRTDPAGAPAGGAGAGLGPDGDQFVLTVSDHRSDDRLRAGYDIVLTGDFDDELLAWEFFGDLRGLGWPSLLCQEHRVLFAWSPTRGARTGSTDADPDSAWEDYVLPAVTAPIEIAAEDLLGRLYARILADPENDDLRLAYAEAVIDDHPRYAELIRRQVAEVRDRRAGAEPASRLGADLYQLARALAAEVLPADARRLRADGHEFGHSLRRGFVAVAFLEAVAFPEVAARLFAACPVQKVHLKSGSPKHLRRLAAVPELGQLRGLSLDSQEIGDESLRALLTSPHLTRLRWLDLSRTSVTAAGIETLAATGATPGLRYVRADRDLRLNPEYALDWDGSLAWTFPAELAERLGQRFPAAWLHRDSLDHRSYHDPDPEYDTV